MKKRIFSGLLAAVLFFQPAARPAPAFVYAAEPVETVSQEAVGTVDGLSGEDGAGDAGVEQDGSGHTLSGDGIVPEGNREANEKLPMEGESAADGSETRDTSAAAEEKNTTRCPARTWRTRPH